MVTSNKITLLLMVMLLLLVSCCVANCESFTDRVAQITSDSIGPCLVVGSLTLLDGGNVKHEAVQMGKTMLATCFATELLKMTVREKRPNSDSRTSFPSGHSSAAFAMATCVAEYEPELAIPAYAVATAIAVSRVEVGAHRWHDVAAGAALGYVVAKHFTGKHVSVSSDGVGFNYSF